MPDIGTPSPSRHARGTWRHLLTIRKAIDAGHPDDDVLSSIDAMGNDFSHLDDFQVELRARLIATAADVVQGWFDNADERALGGAADVAFGRAHDE